MRASVRFCCVIATSVSLLGLVIAGSAQSQPQRKLHVAGDPDGVGGIPFAGGPLIKKKVTAGIVVDINQVAIPNVPVVVLAEAGVVIAAATTDDGGAFALSLPVVGGLTLALPLNGVNGIPIVAGETLLIVVP